MHANLPMTQFLPPPSGAKPAIVRRFLAWVQSAETDARAQGANALVRAYLYSDLPTFVRAEAVLAMTALLDDPSVSVRRSLAEALCRAQDAPRGVVLALAADEPEAAAPVLQYSPVLTEADLVDCVASGDVVAKTALARRPNLPPRAKPHWPRQDTSMRSARSSPISRAISRRNCCTAFLPASATTRACARRCSSARPFPQP